MTGRRAFLLASLVLGNALGRSGAASLTLSLRDLTQSALQRSPRLQAARLDYESALGAASASGAAGLPRVSLDGNYRYVTEVPSFTLPPRGPSLTFGDNNNYNVGVSLTWTLWDFMSQTNQTASLDAVAESKYEVYQAARRQLLLAVRLAYFQVQTGLEHVRLLGDSLKVAQAEFADIEKQSTLGSASRMDMLSSHQEVLDFERQFRQAQAGLAGSLRDLFSLTGGREPADFSLPLDGRMESHLPQDVPGASVWLSGDLDREPLEALKKQAQTPPDGSVPQLRVYALMADAARLASAAVQSQLYPRIAVSGRSDYEYPNGPVLQTIQQNSAGASLSMILFDWGALGNDADSRRKQSESALKSLDQAGTDLARDWNKANDALRSLQAQQSLNQKSVAETEELATLTYNSYRAGRARFLEVESANFRALAAKVQSSDNDLQILMQMSILASLSGESDSHKKEEE